MNLHSEAAGLRISEGCNSRWADVDLAGARLHVEDSKTDAGRRIVDVQPLLLDVLKAHRAEVGELIARLVRERGDAQGA